MIVEIAVQIPHERTPKAWILGALLKTFVDYKGRKLTDAYAGGVSDISVQFKTSGRVVSVSSQLVSSMSAPRTYSTRLDDVVSAASSIYHLVQMFTIFKDQQCDRLLREWLLQQAPGSVFAELDGEGDEYKFVRKNSKGNAALNVFLTSFPSNA